MNSISCHVWKQEKQLSAVPTSRKEIKLHEKKRTAYAHRLRTYTHSQHTFSVSVSTIFISSAFSAPFWFSCSYISISFCKWALDWCHYRLWSPCNCNMSKITSSTHRGHFTFHVHSSGCYCRCCYTFFLHVLICAHTNTQIVFTIEINTTNSFNRNSFCSPHILSFFFLLLSVAFICFEYVHMFEIFVCLFTSQRESGK